MRSRNYCLLVAALDRTLAASGSSNFASSGARDQSRRTSTPLTAFSSPFATPIRGADIPCRKVYPSLYLNVNQDYLSSLTNADADEEECTADDCLLTPQIYATSDDAEHKVEDNIFSKASSAFESTDFEHEPHLSPELEDAEAAYEIAAIANAAHAFAESAEKESKQSMEAMLEREKEMAWIQNHQEDEVAPFFLSPKVNLAERNQRALLEARLDMDRKAKVAAAKKNEELQRSLLAARFAMEKKSKDILDAESNELRSEWMESEALAAAMGVEHTTTLGLASAAAFQAGVSIEKTESYDTEEIDTPVSKLASTAERMILGEDIALDIALIEEAEEHVTDGQQANAEQIQQKKSISEINQWRQDYVQEIRNYMQKKAAEQTKHRLSRKNKTAVEVVSSSDSASENTGTTIASFKSENNAVKRALDNGLIRRMRQRRRLIITALVMVLTRRLVLAWWGNALRLI